MIEKRLPRWQVLERLFREAKGLTVATEVGPYIEAVRTNRGLLDDPDPVAPLCQQLAQSLREALQGARAKYLALYEEEMKRLTSNETWKRLTEEKWAEILNRQGISDVPEIRVGTEQELLASLAESSLQSWATLCDALPQRFTRALEEATKYLEPKAVRVILPPVTIHNEEELRTWLDEVETKLREQLGKGPVIV